MAEPNLQRERAGTVPSRNYNNRKKRRKLFRTGESEVFSTSSDVRSHVRHQHVVQGTNRLNLAKTLEIVEHRTIHTSDNTADDSVSAVEMIDTKGETNRRNSVLSLPERLPLRDWKPSTPSSLIPSKKKTRSMVLTDDDDALRESIDVAAFAHVLGWSESAEIIKTKIAEQDEELISQSGTCSRALINCCCPSFLCCSKGIQPILDVNDQADLCMTGTSVYAKHATSKYSFCCCGSYTRLSLGSALFIWYNLPLGVVRFRFILLTQVAIQLITTYFQWLFFFAVIKSQEQLTDSGEDLKVPESVRNLVVTVFFLPDILHAIWVTEAPGYHLRDKKRKRSQAVYSLLAQFGARPLYDLLWSFKFSSLLPYVTLQNQGSIVTDSLIHERFLIWQGLASTLRELPLRVCQLYVLIEFFPFWGQSDWSTAQHWIDVASGNSKSSLSQCVKSGGNIDENIIMMSFVLGFIASAMALSDQLEREMPHGAFPRRFSRVLAGDLWGTPALLWSAVFMFVFFIDLTLRLLVLIPLFCAEGLFSGLTIFLLSFAIMPSLLCAFMMTDRCDKKQSKLLTMNRYSSDVGLVKKSKLKLKQSSSDVRSMVAREKRAGMDAYDQGMRLGALEDAESQNCFGCSSTGRSKKVGTIIETFPFVLWSLWVDLPLRLKWLRLTDGTNKTSVVSMFCLGKVPKSLAYYLLTSLNSVMFACIIYGYNLFTLSNTMAHSQIRCIKIIPAECQIIFQQNNMTCPTNMTSLLPFVKSNQDSDTWINGCMNSAGKMCMPEVKSYTTGRNNYGAEVARWLLDAITPAFEWKNHGPTTKSAFPIFQWFVVFLMLKVFITVIVAWQFYFVLKQHRGQFQCCCQRLRCWFVFRRLCCFWPCCCLCCCGEQRSKHATKYGQSHSIDQFETKHKMVGTTAHVPNSNLNYSRVAQFCYLACCWWLCCPNHSNDRSIDGGDDDYDNGISNKNNGDHHKEVDTKEIEIQIEEDGLTNDHIHRNSAVPKGRKLWRKRGVRRYQLREDHQLWISELRARDIQLMLRMFGVMRSGKAIRSVTREELDMVEAARYILGRGGTIDHNLARLIARSVSHTSSEATNQQYQTNISIPTSTLIPTPAQRKMQMKMKVKMKMEMKQHDDIKEQEDITNSIVAAKDRILASRKLPNLSQLSDIVTKAKRKAREQQQMTSVYGKGKRVVTSMGLGQIVRLRSDGFVEISLDWMLTCDVHARMVVLPKNITAQKSMKMKMKGVKSADD